MKTLYTAEALATGEGRDGHGRTSDGKLDLDLAIPKEMGGSGNGEQIAANKVKGARCALAWSVETAQLAREHNNAQLIGIGGRMHTEQQALEIVDAFLDQEWSRAERHQRRIDILAEYERTGIAPELPEA